MTLMEALDKGLAHSSFLSFYYLCRSILIKTEADYDKFDAVFAEYFKDVHTPEDLPAEFWKWLSEDEQERDINDMGTGDEWPKELEEVLRLFRERIEEQKENGEPLELDKMQVRKLLERSGAPEENLEQFEKQYDEEIGAQMTVMANNISDTRKFEVKTPQMTVKVSPEQAGLVETRMIDGVPCLVIPLTDEVEVNGIHVHLRDEEVLKNLE